MGPEFDKMSIQNKVHFSGLLRIFQGCPQNEKFSRNAPTQFIFVKNCTSLDILNYMRTLFSLKLLRIKKSTRSSQVFNFEELVSFLIRLKSN